MHPGMGPYQQNNSMGGYGQQGGQYGPQGLNFWIGLSLREAGFGFFCVCLFVFYSLKYC